MAATTRATPNQARTRDETPTLEDITTYDEMRVFARGLHLPDHWHKLFLHLRVISVEEEDFRSALYVSSREWAAHMIGVFTTIGACTVAVHDGEFDLQFSKGADPIALTILMPFIDDDLRYEYFSRNRDGTARSLLLLANQIGKPVTLELLIDCSKKDEHYLSFFKRCDDSNSLVVNKFWRNGIADLVKEIITNDVEVVGTVQTRPISQVTSWEWVTLAKDVGRITGVTVRVSTDSTH